MLKSKIYDWAASEANEKIWSLFLKMAWVVNFERNKSESNSLGMAKWDDVWIYGNLIDRIFLRLLPESWVGLSF